MIEHVRTAAGRGSDEPGAPHRHRPPEGGGRGEERGRGLGAHRPEGDGPRFQRHGGAAGLLPGESGLRALFETGGASIADLAGLSGWTAARLVRHATARGWRLGGAPPVETKSNAAGASGRPPRRRKRGGGASGGGKAGGDVAGRAAEPADRAALVKRLTDAFERQVAEIEARVETRTGEPGATGERDARTLAVLAKTLETLIDLDRSARAETPDADEEGALDGLREDLARRLDRLRGAR